MLWLLGFIFGFSLVIGIFIGIVRLVAENREKVAQEEIYRLKLMKQVEQEYAKKYQNDYVEVDVEDTRDESNR